MLWRPGTQSKSARLSLVGNEVILARCERVVMARLEAPLGATNALIEPSQKCSQDGVLIARTLVRARPRGPVRIMNATNQGQVLSEGTAVGHGEPAMCVANINDQKPEPRRKQGLCKQLKEVIVVPPHTIGPPTGPQQILSLLHPDIHVFCPVQP